MQKIDIFDFLNPIDFLQAYLSYESSMNNLNIRKWANMMELKNAATLVNLLNEKKKIQVKHIDFLQKGVILSDEEKLYLIYMIGHFNASVDEERKSYLKLMEGIKINSDKDKQVLTYEESESLYHWLDYALMAALMMRSSLLEEEILDLFKATKESIVLDSLNKLVKLNLILKENDSYSISHKNISTKNDSAALGIKKYYAQVIDLCKGAINNDLDKREFQCFSQGISIQDIDTFKSEFRNFRNRIEYLANKSNQDTVYQFNLYFFPLTHSLNNLTLNNESKENLFVGNSSFI